MVVTISTGTSVRNAAWEEINVCNILGLSDDGVVVAPKSVVGGNSSGDAV